MFICVLKYQLEASKCTLYGAFSFRDVTDLGHLEIHQPDSSFDFSKIEAFYKITDQDQIGEHYLGKAVDIVSTTIIKGNPQSYNLEGKVKLVYILSQ